MPSPWFGGVLKGKPSVWGTRFEKHPTCCFTPFFHLLKFFAFVGLREDFISLLGVFSFFPGGLTQMEAFGPSFRQGLKGFSFYTQTL